MNKVRKKNDLGNSEAKRSELWMRKERKRRGMTWFLYFFRMV